METFNLLDMFLLSCSLTCLIMGVFRLATGYVRAHVTEVFLGAFMVFVGILGTLGTIVTPFGGTL